MKFKYPVKKLYNTVLRYFLTNIVDETYIIRQKAVAFIIINIAGIFLNLLHIIFIIKNDSNTNLITSLVTFIILIISLILIKKVEFKIVGNFFTLALIIMLIIKIHLPIEGFVMQEYIDEFYFLLSFLVLCILFATDKAIIIGAIFIFTGTITSYLLKSLDYNQELQFYSITGIINFEFAVFIVTVVLLVTSRIIHRNNLFAEKQSHLYEIQKDKAVNAFNAVSTTSDSMNEMSLIINDLTQNLNKSTNKQAVNIEEMSSTIEVLNESILKNAEYASQAAQSSGERTMVVRRSERLLKRVISSIRDISMRITFIQDIARQTNILSLNAAIESARAGRSGRGFSAVANGIKKLAEQSQKSAKDIISLVNEGLSVSDQANDYLSAIVENSEKTTELMTKISEALMEQINNITQINIGMSEINNSAQTNANIVDELATNVEIMKENSDIQRELFHDESLGL